MNICRSETIDNKNYGPSPIEAQKSLLGSAIQQSEKPEGQRVTNPSASLQE